MKFLLDTCVLAEARRAAPDTGVVAALQALPDDGTFISVISIGEISKGIALLADGHRKQELTAWLDSLERQYEAQILPIDRETAHVWGRVTAAAQKTGRTVPAADGLIASTALRHGLTVMTRNTADFECTGVPVMNPWSSPPAPAR